MNTKNIIFKTKTASEGDIRSHLNLCDDFFSPPLSSRINIDQYAEKIVKNAITFEAWNKNELIGLIAAYLNIENQTSFITNVSVLKEFMGTGVSGKLLSNGFDYLLTNHYKKVDLEVNKNNTKAIDFYKKHNFMETGTIEDSIQMCYLISN